MMSGIFTPILRCTVQINQLSLLDSVISKSRCLSTTISTFAKDYYSILGVPKSATAKEIKTAYYDKAKVYHPDANPSPETVTKFQEVSEAYEILGDEQKRRVYDTTRRPQVAHDVYGHAKASPRDVPYRPRQGPIEPINMKHINHVYRALNKAENEEQPVYAPFADHCHPGTHYNRFEFSRFWDKDQRRWVYVKKPTAAAYNKRMERNQKDLITVLTIIMLGVLSIPLFRNLQSSPYKITMARKDEIEYSETFKRSKQEREALDILNANKLEG